MALIEVTNLKYRYPHTEKLALDGLDFLVEKGSFIGIVGENKAGKSTLCQALVGLVPTMFKGAYGGKIVIDGQEAAKTPVALLCQKVGLIFQNPFNQLSGAKDTVFGEIAFGLQNLGVPREEIVRRVEENLRLLDIEQYRDRNPFDLSGGQTQRVAIASILAMQPEIIVLDEPTSQLDPQGSEEVFRVVDKLSKTGITIIMVEHKMEKLASYCDKILLLHDGKQIAYDTPEKIFSRDDLEELGVEAPVFTRVCRKLSVCRKEEGKRLYPVTMEQTMALRDQFPAGLSGKRMGAEGLPAAADRMSGEIFRIKDLSFHYLEHVPVLEGLAMELDTRPTAVIGQNGAGKTTLTKLLTGLLKPASGSVRVTGLDTAAVPTSRIAREVATLFQNPDRQICKDTVLDEVAFGLELGGMDRAEALRRAQLVIDRFGLPADEAPFSLSRGQRQMVALASVVVVEPKIVVLDEPTSGLDYRECMTVMETVRTMAERGCAVIMVCHDMEVVSDFAERIVVMADGRILDRGRTHELFSNIELMQRAYVEPPQVIELSRRLASSVSPAFAQVSEVTDIVRITEEMDRRG